MGKKDQKDHRHKRKKESRKHKSRHRSPSTSSTSSEEWVEKVTAQKKLPEPSHVRDDWMSMETCFSGKTRKELNDMRKKNSDKSEERASILDQPGQSGRELNPFWKNGGTGLPSECESRNTSVPSGVGDNGVRWLRKALERAKEKAEEEGRSLEDVISERWGSLDEFNKVLKDAEKQGHKHSYSRYDSEKNSDRDRHQDNNRHRDHDKPNDRHRDHHQHIDRHETNKKRLNFRKPDEDSFDSGKTYKSYESQSSRRNWKKPSSNTSSVQECDSKAKNEVTSENSKPSNVQENREVVSGDEEEINAKILSLNELNHLCAAVLRAELSGNIQLARKLESDVKVHKQRRKNALKNKEIRDESADKVIILTETDSRGFTRPVKCLETSHHSGKRKTETHEGQKRVRYFADDDKYSLKEMFEREKYNAVDDDQSTFLKLVAKETQDDMDVEGVFDQARMGESSKDENKKRAKLIKKHIALEKSVENCRWCIDSKMMSEECIVLSKSKVYVAAPTSQSLTERHCLIVPFNHVACGTLLDEDVWEEIMELRKKLVNKLEEDNEDIIFFEIANNLHKHPHMVLHCVPVPKECGDTAPIYFKKAIMECETEWSNNKKVVDLAGRDVRKAVPKGLPYFSVDFGMQSGYAHVIEDNRLFPNNFGQEIIGGMLDLDHSLWRKPRRDSPENIIKKVELIKKLFEETS